MLLLSCPSKLRRLEEMLKKTLHQALQTHGVVMNINRGNPVGHEVVVDSWPDFKAVLTRPGKEIARHPADAWGNMHTAFYTDFDAFRRLLKDTDAVKWDHHFVMYGNVNGMYEALEDAAASRKVKLIAEPCFSFIHPDPTKMPEHQLPPGFTLSTVDNSHIDLLNETWLLGGATEHSRKYLADMARCFPSVSVKDSRGQIVSWYLKPKPSAAAPLIMLILSCPSKLRMLEEMLKKNLHQALQAHGVVMNINRGNPVGNEVVVDSWPDFKAVLTRPGKEIARHPADAWGNMHTAFYTDFDAFQRLLKDTDAINWDHHFLMYGNVNGMYEALEDAAASRKVKLIAEPCFSFIHPDPTKLPEHQLPPGFTLSTVDNSHIDLLNETWVFGGATEHSRKYLADMVRCFPSVSVKDSRGQIVSWSVMHSIASGGHAYTLEAHRGKRLFLAVLGAFSQQLHAAGFPVYIDVALNNVRMQKVLEQNGFQRVSDICLFSQFYPP